MGSRVFSWSMSSMLFASPCPVRSFTVTKVKNFSHTLPSCTYLTDRLICSFVEQSVVSSTNTLKYFASFTSSTIFSEIISPTVLMISFVCSNLCTWRFLLQFLCASSDKCLQRWCGNEGLTWSFHHFPWMCWRCCRCLGDPKRAQFQS